MRLVKTEMRKAEVRVYAVSISEPPGAGPQPGGGCCLSFSLDKHPLFGGTRSGMMRQGLVLPAPQLHPSSLGGHKAQTHVPLCRDGPLWRCTHAIHEEKSKQEKDYQGGGDGGTVSVGCLRV